MVDWQIITIVVAIVVPTSIFVINRWMQRKVLSYYIDSPTPLLNIQDKDKYGIQILFHKEPVQDVYLIEMEIFNSGFQEIRREDFDSPISFNFGGNTQILSVEKSKVIPESLQPSFEFGGSTLSLKPILLNSKDKIIFKIFASNYKNEPIPNVRIAGIKDIKDGHKLEQTGAIYKTISGLIIGILGIYALIKTMPPEATTFLFIFIFYLIYSIVGFYYMGQGITYLKETKKIST